MLEAQNVERYRVCEPFEAKMRRLTATLRKQQKAARLDAAIAANLKELGYGG